MMQCLWKESSACSLVSEGGCRHIKRFLTQTHPEVRVGRIQLVVLAPKRAMLGSRHSWQPQRVECLYSLPSALWRLSSIHSTSGFCLGSIHMNALLCFLFLPKTSRGKEVFKMFLKTVF